MNKSALILFGKKTLEVVFIDWPWLLDSAMRHTEYWVNTRYVLVSRPNQSPRWQRKTSYSLLILLSAVLIFSMYGPTFAALCSIFENPRNSQYGLGFVALLCAFFTVYLFFKLWSGGCGLIMRRQKKLRGQLWEAYTNQFPTQASQPNDKNDEDQIRLLGTTDKPYESALPINRMRWLKVFLASMSLILVMPFASMTYLMWSGAFDPTTCGQAGFDHRSLYQLGFTCALIILAWTAPKWVPILLSQNWLWTPVCFFLTLLSCFFTAIVGYGHKEADYLPYFGSYPVLASVLFLIATISGFLAPKCIIGDIGDREVVLGVKFKQALGLALNRCELFVPPAEPKMDGTRFGYAVFAPLSYPLLLLLIPSFSALIAPRLALYKWFWGMVLLSWLFIAMGNVSSRWNQQLVLVKRWFLTGLPLIVSFAVMSLALCRLFDIDYVSYVMDAAPFGVVTMNAAMAYLLAWTVEGCLHRPLQIELLKLFSVSKTRANRINDLRIGRLPYKIQAPYIATKVKQNGRWLQPHGDGRFVVVGRLDDPAKPAFQTYRNYDLFERVVTNERCHLASAEFDRLEECLHELHRRIQNYFTFTNSLVALVALGIILVLHYQDNLARKPLAEVSRSLPADYHGFNLLEKLAAQQSQGRPALLIAASGGGTRAALYTTAALCGLSKLNHSHDIVLTSGISGGGVSLSYFSAYHPELLNEQCQFTPDSTNNPWYKFFQAISYDHIQDVLQGIGEWRLFWGQSLAQLLVESFDRQFGKPTVNLGQIQDVGLILNTTLTAHPYQDSVLLKILNGANTRTPVAPVYNRLAGGRLIFTNLDPSIDFSGYQDIAKKSGDLSADVGLTYKTIRDPNTPITAAAALNANFPPVFADSGVWEYCDTSHQISTSCPINKYYVTDGGINENRGLIPLLTALGQALKDWDCKKNAAIPLPEIHIMVLDASAMSIDYNPQSRGFDNIISGSSQERLSGGLEKQLLQNILEQEKNLRSACAAEASKQDHSPSKIHIHYLLMPAVFVTRGGFGTHWMLPSKVTFNNPGLTVKHDPLTLTDTETQTQINCLFTTGESTPLENQACTNLTRKFGDKLIDAKPCDSNNSIQCVFGWDELLQDLASNGAK